jgi:hypothetical protein
MAEDTLRVEARPVTSRKIDLRYDNRFFAAVAVVSLAAIFIGFARTYYLAGLFKAPLPSLLVYPWRSFFAMDSSVHHASLTHHSASRGDTSAARHVWLWPGMPLTIPKSHSGKCRNRGCMKNTKSDGFRVMYSSRGDPAVPQGMHSNSRDAQS